MNTKYKKSNTNSKRGAALLMAVLISSVMLSIGIGVYQRTYKQLVFSSFWKQMQIAFAAADGGLECALYWDLRPGALSPTCFRVATGWAPGSATVATGVNLVTSGGCVNVTITKPSPLAPYLTRIDSRGYNDACGSTNPRRVERALKIDY